jgi:hypothetical protein
MHFMAIAARLGQLSMPPLRCLLSNSNASPNSVLLANPAGGARLCGTGLLLCRHSGILGMLGSRLHPGTLRTRLFLGWPLLVPQSACMRGLIRILPPFAWT